MIPENIIVALYKAIQSNILVYDIESHYRVSKNLLDLCFTTYKNNINKNVTRVKQIFVDDLDCILYDHITGNQIPDIPTICIDGLTKSYENMGGSVVGPNVFRYKECAKKIVLVEMNDGGFILGSY